MDRHVKFGDVKRRPQKQNEHLERRRALTELSAADVGLGPTLRRH